MGWRRGAGGIQADEVLTYVSAATLTIDWEAFYDEGPLRAR
jgi:hypothetical protein